jgi:hypothetical protein
VAAENHFRYARIQLDLDSHDAYATTDDGPTPLVPNPAKKEAHRVVLAALLEAMSPPPGESVWIINAGAASIIGEQPQPIFSPERAARAGIKDQTNCYGDA